MQATLRKLAGSESRVRVGHIFRFEYKSFPYPPFYTRTIECDSPTVVIKTVPPNFTFVKEGGSVNQIDEVEFTAAGTFEITITELSMDGAPKVTVQKYVVT